MMQRRTLVKLLASAMLNGVCLPLLPTRLMAAAKRNGKRMILVELSGANDGLNTVVPFNDERYHALRPTIGLKKKDVVALDDSMGLHRALQALMPLWEAGELAVVHGLGYPLPNRSHFKSISLWESGGDGVTAGRQGWLTHAIEHKYVIGQVDAHGISLDGRLGVFVSDSGHWLSMTTAMQFNGNLTTADVEYAQPSANSALNMILSRTRTLNRSIKAIAAKMATANPDSGIGGHSFGAQLDHAVNLIKAGVETPVLKVSLGGFDTHENQHWKHRERLQELAHGLNGLRYELKDIEEWDNTLIMTYSEFGRRARENRSSGTDHGTAAAHFVMGGAIRGGQYGDHPDLDSLLDDDLQFTMDYRSLYHMVLSQWFETAESNFSDYQDSRLGSLI